MNRLTILLLSAFCATALSAQTTYTLQRTLNWAEEPFRSPLTNGEMASYWRFDGCSYGEQAPTLPLMTDRFPLAGASALTVELTDVQYERFDFNPTPAEEAVLSTDLIIDVRSEQERQQHFGRLRFIPIRKNGSTYERVRSFSLNVRITPRPVAPSGGVTDRGPNTSVLSNGSIYKFGVAQSGIYKLDFNYLKNELGITNLESIDPRNLKVYGNGGNMLPEKTDDARPDDLIENAIFVSGEQDGKFDAGDFILFYAQGPAPWRYTPDAINTQLNVRKHLYDPYAYYFVKIGDGTGLRVQEQASVPASAQTEAFDDVQRIEDEKVNLLDFFALAQGSGKRWFGDYFLQTREREYALSFPNLVPNETARLRAEFAGRSGSSTTVRFSAGDGVFNRSINGVPVSNNEADYAANGTVIGSFIPDGGNNILVNVEYLQGALSSEGWLDYIEVNARRRLAMGAQNSLEFRDLKSLNNTATTFKLSDASPNTKVWDITNPQVPMRQNVSFSGTTLEFGANTLNVLRNFIAFNENAVFPAPETNVGAIANQNLHAIDNQHMAIIYHPDFKSQAEQLADHRRNFSGLDVVTVPIDQLYNEFSSGAKDPTAIRDFARLLLTRQPNKFEFLLLIGDGSFDPKNNTASTANIDFIPVFETYESYDPIYSYPSDDYFGLLSDGEGGALDGALDIAVGRLTVNTPDEAQTVVDKIMAYDKDPQLLGDWHLRQLFMADDQDFNAHLAQADKLANQSAATEKWFNIEKVFFDAYQQVATSGGQRFPDAKAAINSNVFKGTLIMQYIGHGGPRGWAQERVVDNNDIASWDNPYRYPFIITATCSFGGYDDYGTLTGGEQALLRNNAGAVGMFTTVRAVFVDGNNKLTDAVQKVIFQRVNGWYRPVGEILRVAKNTLSGGIEDNARRFTLLGDPAMFLAMPEYRVSTTHINDVAVTAGQPDTLKALMPVKIDGIVTDTLGNLLSNYNGKVSVTLFDKTQDLLTLGQDSDSPVRGFNVQRNVIFKGSATVTAGKFSIEFIVPKDINYAFGKGKISYYAQNGTPLDAAGADDNIVVGGNANLINDDKPPVVQIFMNTTDFVLGGVTDNSPKILVKCEDDNGMNVTGASLGHDLTAVLDGNVLETVVLNDFYESEQDNYRRGQAIYPLRNLEPGKHTLKAKGWDIANNSGEGYTEFIVAEDGKVALEHVLNYPNPFTTNTYFQFEHNLSGQVLDVQISIFSVSGKLVKTILHNTPADGYRVADISWDGRDEYGDRLARGVYVYRVKIRGTDASGTQVTAESDYEKLVILK
ncbi:MAG: type IX secretion system sortase PorU [Saprospiraceae bacterium]|nr:type IX secretion system sortase PorU [Saprospiraceae bacterium]